MKTVVITGGSRGLGFELAKQFRDRNYNVVICATSEESTEKAVNQLKTENAKVAGKKCNVSDVSEVEALADFAVSQFGSIDIWINNAGVNQSFKYFWELDEKELDFLMAVDLKGAVNGTGVAVRRMMKQGHGAVYNVEGMGSEGQLQSCFSLYGTAKRAVTYFTDAAVHEVKEKNLPVIIGKISPGIMITDFLTSANGRSNQTELSEKTKNAYNILGDYPDVIAEYIVNKIEANKKNGARLSWLTKRKAMWRMMTSGIKKRKMI